MALARSRKSLPPCRLRSGSQYLTVGHAAKPEANPAGSQVPTGTPLIYMEIIGLLYVALVAVVFSRVEGWALTDSFYFSVVTFTTVGYGDMTPRHPVSRLIVAGHVLVELLLFVLSAGRIIDRFMSREVSGLRQRMGAVAANVHNGLMSISRQARRRAITAKVVALFAWVGFTAVLSHHWLGISWIDALYFSVVTLTTTGFGDIVPQDTAGRLFVGVLCLIGVPLFGTTLAGLAQLRYQKARDLRLECIRKLTESERLDLERFCIELEGAAPYNAAREGGLSRISPFEYLCFEMIRSDFVTVKDIESVVSNFRKLDKTGDGYLDPEDIPDVTLKA